jgi:hypothetical protein
VFCFVPLLAPCFTPGGRSSQCSESSVGACRAVINLPAPSMTPMARSLCCNKGATCRLSCQAMNEWIRRCWAPLDVHLLHGVCWSGRRGSHLHHTHNPIAANPLTPLVVARSEGSLPCLLARLLGGERIFIEMSTPPSQDNPMRTSPQIAPGVPCEKTPPNHTPRSCVVVLLLESLYRNDLAVPSRRDADRLAEIKLSYIPARLQGIV